MCSSRKIAKILGIAAINGALYAAGGAINGAIGASVMRDAHHDGYNVLESVRMGAAGGAVIGAAIGMVKEILHVLDKEFDILCRSDEARNKDHFDNSIQTAVGELILSLATITASGALGHEMLKDMIHMSLQMSVVALLVGSAVFAGAFLALACCCIGCCLCLAASKACLQSSNDSSPRVSIQMPSFGDFRKTSIHDVGAMGEMFRKVSIGDVEAPKEAPATTPSGPSLVKSV